MRASNSRRQKDTYPFKKIFRNTHTRISEKAGLPPGSVIYTGLPKGEPTRLTLIRYNEDEVTELSSAEFSEIALKTDKKQVNWINMDSLHDTELIHSVGNQFNIHPLTLEDIAHVGHSPKLEQYDQYLFFTLKLLKPLQQDDPAFSFEHISFVLAENLLISFQEYRGDPFDPIRERIRAGKGKARTRGADYLLFLLTDAIVDQYLLSAETINRQISEIELAIFEMPHEKLVTRIIEQKKMISAMRSIIYPVRDSLKELTTGESEFIDEAYFNYFNDVYDHIKNIVDHLANQSETLTTLMEFYMSRISHQMNKVMQSLTMIATIFIPLTFLVGIYGMNFRYMPELEIKWAYPALLVLMLVLGLGMYIYMKRKHWF